MYSLKENGDMQATMAYSNEREHKRSGPSFILIMLIIALIITGGYAVSHAVEKHKEEAIATRDCIDRGGADIVYFKTDDRAVQLCLIPGRGLGIRPMEKIKGVWQELTGYINQDVTSIDGALGYAEQDMGKYGWISYIKQIYGIVIR